MVVSDVHFRLACASHVVSPIDFVQSDWTLRNAISRRSRGVFDTDTGTRMGWREQIRPTLEAAFDAEFECLYICLPQAIKEKGLVCSIVYFRSSVC